jgi:3-dehydroquinate synthase
LIDDPAFFAWLEANGTGVLAGHRALREQAVAAAIRAKARIVAGDIDDRNGKRALLNFGHSFAHAIESETGLGEILHGEAVAIGMAMALRLSAQSGLCAADEADRAIAHLVAAGLPTRLTDIGLAGRGAALARWIERDKKNAPGRLTLILTRGIGRAFVDSNFDSKRLENFLSQAS